MSDEDKRQAKVLADRAAAQAKHAAKNTTRAAKAAAKVAAEEAGDVVEEVNDTAEDAVEAVGDKVVKPGLKFFLTPGGKAVLGYTFGIAAIAYATRQAKLNSRLWDNAAKADHHIRPSQP